MTQQNKANDDPDKFPDNKAIDNPNNISKNEASPISNKHEETENPPKKKTKQRTYKCCQCQVEMKYFQKYKHIKKHDSVIKELKHTQSQIVEAELEILKLKQKKIDLLFKATVKEKEKMCCEVVLKRKFL